MSSIGQEFRFGEFRLDLDRGCLYRAGNIVPLGARSLEILQTLALADGRIVSKDELMARVWPRQIIEENTLQVHVSALRKALGEGVGGNRYILTVSGRGYRFLGDYSGRRVETAEAVPHEKVGLHEVISLANMPSIAVMPFENMSDGGQQEYFSDGLVEDIITALSRWRGLFVIARNSSFTYKGRAFDVKQVGRELGVRYLLEGGIRRAQQRVRVTCQLIDAATGIHLWADRFDRDLQDVFALQDQITSSVVGAIAPKVEEAEIERSKRKPTESLDAYDFYLRGMASLHRLNRESVTEALGLYLRAIALDSDYAAAYGMAAWCYVQRKANGWLESPRDDAFEAVRLGRKAVQLGRDDAIALHRGGHALTYLGLDFDAGLRFVTRALELNPNLAAGWYSSSWIHVWIGEPELAVEHVRLAIRLSPIDPLMSSMFGVMAYGHFFAGRYDEAALCAEHSLQEKPDYHISLRVAAASNALAGRLEAARAKIDALRRVDPQLRLSNWKKQTPLKREIDQARYELGLRTAGLPE